MLTNVGVTGSYQIKFRYRDQFPHDSNHGCSWSQIINLRVEQFEKDREFADKQNSQKLKTHLTAVSHYEEKEKDKKAIKHMIGFKVLLDHQIENEFISENAYNDLTSETNELIKKWQ